MQCFDSREIDAARALLRRCLAARLGVDEEAITDEHEFVNSLGADSLDTVELVMELEEEFDLNISDEDAESLQTVADALAFLQRRRDSAGSQSD